MEVDQAIGLIRQMIWETMAVSAPVLIATLLTGLVVSILQATTQIQEMTLGYVPKLFVAAFVIIAFGGWMMARISHFATSLIAIIPTIS